ncbi:MAG TPA: hypothetical protein VG710_04045 [Opitutus sp.]|nr:hypothetical protein [Opitutus sp.]
MLAFHETDGPALVLPRLTVEQRRIELDEHDVLTTKGRLEFAKARELSPLYRKTFGPLALVAAAYFNPLVLLTGAQPNDAEAMVLYEQDERLRRLRAEDELIEIYRKTDPAAFQQLKSSVRDSFLLVPIGLKIH